MFHRQALTRLTVSWIVPSLNVSNNWEVIDTVGVLRFEFRFLIVVRLGPRFDHQPSINLILALSLFLDWDNSIELLRN